jgi:hypothetical protein
MHEQNLPLGAAAGITASVVMGLLWAAITVITEYQIGYMAVAVGFGVGYAIRYAGRGFDQIFGITGAVLALLGCLIGNFFSLVGFVVKSQDVNLPGPHPDRLRHGSRIDAGSLQPDGPALLRHCRLRRLQVLLSPDHLGGTAHPRNGISWGDSGRPAGAPV